MLAVAGAFIAKQLGVQPDANLPVQADRLARRDPLNPAARQLDERTRRQGFP